MSRPLAQHYLTVSIFVLDHDEDGAHLHQPWVAIMHTMEGTGASSANVRASTREELLVQIGNHASLLARMGHPK